MVGRSQSYNENRVVTFVDGLGSELPELGLIAGVFSSADVLKAKPGHGELSAVHAIEFARFAAADYALSATSRVTHFNYDTAFRILNGQRESRLYSQAQADFDKLRSLGVENASLCNLGGLIYSAQRKPEQSADLFERAVSLDDKSVIFKSNFGTVATTPGQVERALRLLASVNDSKIDELRQTHQFGYFCYAKLLAIAGLENSASFNPARFARMGPQALALEETKNSWGRELIERALATLTL